MATRRRAQATSRWQYSLETPTTLVAQDRRALAQAPVRLEGRVAAGPGNRLEFIISPASARAAQVHPSTIRIDGAWQLRDDRTLIFTAQESTQVRRSRLVLRGGVVRAEAHRLVFAIERDEAATSSQELTLSGRWAASPGQRLRFLARQADGTETPLTLEGAWEVGARHELAYRLAARRRARGIERVSTLTFDGAWDLAASRRLRYRLRGASDSSFEFEAAARTPSVMAREGALVYDVGVRLARGRTRRVRVALFGAWKVGRNRAIEFEVPYAGGRVQAIRFTAAQALSRRSTVEVALATARGERLGLSVVLARRLAGEAKLFVRASRDGEERAVLGGVQVRF